MGRAGAMPGRGRYALPMGNFALKSFGPKRLEPTLKGKNFAPEDRKDECHRPK